MILIFAYINILFLKLDINLNKKLKIILNIILAIILIILIANLRKNYKSDNIEDKYRILNGITHTRMIISFINHHNLGLGFDNEVVEFFKQKNQSLYKEKPKENIKNIILIIGESFAKNKSNLYGGYLNTNPMLKKLQNSGNLILFEDTIAPAYATELVMRSLLNFSNYENTTSQNNWYKHLDIITLFNKYGYKTFFISNQEATNDSAAFLTGTNANYVHFENKFANPIKASEKSKPDEVLFDKIKNLDLSNNNFIIIHLMGSHAGYENRYTKDFDKFKQDDIKDKKEHKKILASYYNSVLYNDFIISSIFDIFSSDDSVILYLSDHGEALYDDKKGMTLTHGIVDKSIADIPFMIIFTDTFKSLHKNLIKKINASNKKPYMSDDLIHTICDLAGIYPNEFDEKRSVINDNFNTHRKRMFMGVDYELLK